MTPAEVVTLLGAVATAAVEAGELPGPPPAPIKVERPRQREHGDYASSVALQWARSASLPAAEVATILAARLRAHPAIAAAAVAGPGFINVTLAGAALGDVARTVVTAGADYGRSAAYAGLSVNLEFVSANPTGPIHIGGTRWAAVGDAIGRLLTFTGASVTREYYVNDAGRQVDRFADSLLAAARGLPAPPDGYAGAYVQEIAHLVLARHPGVDTLPDEQALPVFRATGMALMLAEIRTSLEAFGTHFDVFFSEQSLHDSGRVQAAINRLRDLGHVYDADGAVWLRTSAFGDDKDRVLVKSDGDYAYISGDVAYYLDKRLRGADLVILMLGADHHGYIGRLRAVAASFGDDPDQHLEVLIGQMVNLVRDGEPVRMSKRAGNVVTLEDLVDVVGVDAARYALARSSVDSAMTLDVDLLRRQASDNPVFYVQYAATRAASILRRATALGIALPDPAATEVGLLTHPEEVALLGALAEFPEVVRAAAELRAPHRVARYLEEEVARRAQRVFDDCQVLPRGDETATPLTAARLLLWQAVRVVLVNGLTLLGVSAPEQM